MGNVWFLAAGAVVFLTAGIHVFAGGRLYVRPLLALEIEPFQKWMAYLMWHLGTVATLFMGAGFVAGALDPVRAELALFATAGAAAFVAVAAYTGLRSGLGLARFPVVPMFSIAVTLGVVGHLA